MPFSQCISHPRSETRPNIPITGWLLHILKELEFCGQVVKSVCILIRAGSLMSHLKPHTLTEQLFQNVALAASEASVLIEKLITSEAFMLMYVL